MNRRPRPFFVPMIGLVLMFAALGPAVGGALFIPLAVVFKTPIDPEAIGLMVLFTALFGHALGLIAAYVVGVAPAAATGFLYALWDAAAPERAPRALVAALIGGLIAYGLLLRLNPVWASFEMTVETDGRLAAPPTGRRPAASESRSATRSSPAPRSPASSAPAPRASSASPCSRNSTPAARLHPPGEGG